MALTLSEMLSILEGGDWCAVRFITADVLKGKGGKVIELSKCRIARRRRSGAVATGDKTVVSHSRNPNHNYWFTRNVELQNKQLRKVHPILITHINHQSVL